MSMADGCLIPDRQHHQPAAARFCISLQSVACGFCGSSWPASRQSAAVERDWKGRRKTTAWREQAMNSCNSSSADRHSAVKHQPLKSYTHWRERDVCCLYPKYVLEAIQDTPCEELLWSVCKVGLLWILLINNFLLFSFPHLTYTVPVLCLLLFLYVVWDKGF